MRQRYRHRQRLSIGGIGRRRFWVGIALAAGFAATSYLFFSGIGDATAVVMAGLHYGHPGIVFPTSEAVDPANPFGHSPLLRFADNLFAAGIAVSAAQSLALSHWFGHSRGQRVRKARLAWVLAGATMWTWLLPWFLLKFGQTYWLYVYVSTWSSAPVPELSMIRDYGWFMVLLVVVFFLEQWKGLRLVFRCGPWIIWAGTVSALLALGLALVPPLDW